MIGSRLLSEIGVTSESVKVLIVEAEAASLASGEAAEQARQQALDPALTANDVAAARRQMEDAAFRRERLQTAVTRLQDAAKRSQSAGGGPAALDRL